ncbi:MAG: sulfurtransferase complex subunit TusB [Halioglobus sp.]|nr:sulfurtransferase complex subunit TusB [Halioglobus sp.]
MILHTLSALPHSGAFADCLISAGETDAILLLGNGVYCVLGGATAIKKLYDTGARLLVLTEHAQQAGVPSLPENFELIDMDGFVELTERYPRQLAWH